MGRQFDDDITPEQVRRGWLALAGIIVLFLIGAGIEMLWP